MAVPADPKGRGGTEKILRVTSVKRMPLFPFEPVLQELLGRHMMRHYHYLFARIAGGDGARKTYLVECMKMANIGGVKRSFVTRCI